MPAIHVCELNQSLNDGAGGVAAAAAAAVASDTGVPGSGNSSGVGGMYGEPGTVICPGKAYTVPPGPLATGVGTGGTIVGGRMVIGGGAEGPKIGATGIGPGCGNVGGPVEIGPRTMMGGIGRG